MKKYAFLSTTALASITCFTEQAMAQNILDMAPEQPTLVALDTVSECSPDSDGIIICAGGVDPTGIGSADPNTDIIIRGDALVEAAAGPSTFFPTFEVGAIIENDMSSITLEDGGQVSALTDFSFGLTSLASENTVSVAGDVVSTGDAGGAITAAFGINNTITIEEGGVAFASGETSSAISATGDGHSIIVNGLAQSQGGIAPGVLVGFGNDISVTVSSTGQVLAEGESSPALSTFIDPTVLTINFDNAGLVQTFGNAAPGIALATSGADAVNSGTIATLSDGSPGVLMVQSDHTLVNTGLISTAGGDLDTTYEEFLGLVLPGDGVTPITIQSAGVFLGNGGVSVTNSGDITASAGPGIVTSSQFAELTNASPFGAGDAALPVTIINEATGTITGTTAILGSDLIEQVTNAGTINGDVLLAGSDDSFTAVLNTGMVSGMIDGGAGSDTLVVTGTGSFDGAGQTGFENLTVTGGDTATLTGTFAAFDTFSVTSSSTALLGADATIDTSSGTLVDAGSTLGGAGTIVGSVTSNGIISLGATGATTPATLTIDGDLILSDTGALQVGLNNGPTDLLAVTGTADLAGAVTIALADGTNLGLLPAMITAVETGGGVTASNQTAQTIQSGVLSLTATPFISGSNVLIGLDITSDFAGLSGLNTNQSAVAGALDGGFAASTAGDAFSGAVGILGATATPDALTQLSAEFYDAATRASVLAANRSREQITERVQEIPFGAAPGVWIAASYESFDRTGDDIFAYEIDQFNAAFGVDARLGSVIAGIAGTYANVDLNVLASPGDDNGSADIFGLLGYVTTNQPDGFNFSATAGYQFVDADTIRTIGIPDLNSTLSANFNPNAFFADLGGSYLHALSETLFIRSGLGVDVVIIDGDSFDEGTTGAFGLAIDAETYEEVAGRAALDLVGRFEHNDLQIRPFLGGFVRRIFTGDAPDFAATFLNAPDGSFIVDGSLDQTEYGINAGLSLAAFDGRATFSAVYRGTFSDNNDAQQGSIQLVIPF